MCRFLGLASNCLSIPEHQTVDPLVTVPTLFMLFRQHLPLPAAWHLFFHANDAAQDQLLLLRIFCAYCRLFLLYPLLLHYLPKPDCVGSDQFVISIH